ncbi:Hypothetical predicted protein [Olea europaea subsp. europaea]|uniref:Uncharacterized protein n=1 Tax=Olea europaea subsp. europaea TaxID=158383 RepID=A0A8S0S2I6_OLEEU|nr:Hypothetical predicted protein [Olea europaea subsp. europaea]CAA2985310.1 Hypothetical predicted protein [Olea europaea subsp. europaea]
MEGLADSYSPTAALSACGQLRLAQDRKSIHSKIVKLGVECSIVVSNCLIDVWKNVVSPQTQHAFLMIWLADKMINELGFESWGLVRRAPLGACVPCENPKVAEKAATK